MYPNYMYFQNKIFIHPLHPLFLQDFQICKISFGITTVWGLMYAVFPSFFISDSSQTESDYSISRGYR